MNIPSLLPILFSNTEGKTWVDFVSTGIKVKACDALKHI